jgi:hypothetical protein
MTDLVRVSDVICLNLELNQLTILVELNVSKAFDNVCHELFILKVRKRYGIHSSGSALVSSLIFHRHQRVH